MRGLKYQPSSCGINIWGAFSSVGVYVVWLISSSTYLLIKYILYCYHLSLEQNLHIIKSYARWVSLVRRCLSVTASDVPLPRSRTELNFILTVDIFSEYIESHPALNLLMDQWHTVSFYLVVMQLKSQSSL